MNTQITFSLSDLGMFVLWGLIVAVLIYILLILIRFYRSFKEVMAIVDDNRENINKVLDEAPDISKNITQISDEAAHFMTAFHGTVDNISETTQSVTGAVKDNRDIVSQINLFFKVIGVVKDGYDRLFGRTTEEEENFPRSVKTVETDEDPSTK